MANYATLRAAIQNVIKTNGNNEITGALLQQSLLAMVNSLGAGYEYVGIATPSTNPGTPDNNVFYIAGTSGTYSNFGAITLEDNEIAILKYNGSWVKDTFGAAQKTFVDNLYNQIQPLVSEFAFAWEQGSLNSLGQTNTSSTRIRTITTQDFKTPLVLNCAPGYGYRVFEYKKTGQFVAYQNFDSGGLGTYIPQWSEPVFKFVLLKTNGASISPSDATEAKFECSRNLLSSDNLSEALKGNSIIQFLLALVGNVPLSIIDGKYYNSTGQQTAFGSYECAEIDVSGYVGKKFNLLAGTLAAVTTAYHLFVNSSNTVLLSVNASTYLWNGIVPNGATKLLISNTKNADNLVTKTPCLYVDTFPVTRPALKTELEQAVTDLTTLINQLSAISVKDELCLFPFTVTQGNYYNQSGGTNSSAAWSTLSPIDVSAYVGKTFRIRAYSPQPSGSQIAYSWFKSENNALISNVYSDANNVIEGIIPENAKWLCISNRWQSFATPSVWIDTIGIQIATKKYVDDIIAGIGFVRNNLTGAKVSFIGDSITAGYYASEAAKRYCNLFCSKYGAVVNNLGVASTCIANNTLNGLSAQRFVTRATAANLQNSKLIVVFGGTNDFSYDSKAIGDLFVETTITPTDYIGDKRKDPTVDTDSFAGALHELISTIRTNCPNVPIVFITPLKRGRYSSGRPTSKECNQWGNFLDDFCVAIKNICAYYSIPVLDANSISELDFSNSAISTDCSQDSLHPNDKGHAILAELLYRFVENNVVIYADN